MSRCVLVAALAVAVTLGGFFYAAVYTLTDELGPDW